MPIADPFTTVVPDLTPYELWDAWLKIYNGDGFNKKKFFDDPHEYVLNILKKQTKDAEGNPGFGALAKKLSKTKAFYEKHWGTLYTNADGDFFTATEALAEMMPEEPAPTGGWDGKTWPPPPTADFMDILGTLYESISQLQKTVTSLQITVAQLQTDLIVFKSAYNNHNHEQFPQYQNPPPTGVTNQKC